MTTTDKDTTAHKLREKAEDVATDVRDAAEAKATEQAEMARDQAADETHRTAEAARAAGDAFGTETVQGEALKQAASRIEDVARTLRNKPVDELMRDVSDFARRHPLLFLGGAAAAGFAAARFLKASPSRTSMRDMGAGDPWSGHLDLSHDRYSGASQ